LIIALSKRRVRSKARWFWLASLAAINQHLDAQIVAKNDSLLLKLGLIKRKNQTA
jgi:hypothetical protein